MEYDNRKLQVLLQEVWEGLTGEIPRWKLKGDIARPAQTRSESRADLGPTFLPRPKSSSIA
jgi:hypothetical protein